MNSALKPQAVKLEAETVEKLKSLEISMGGITLKTPEQKIKHLIWFYEHYKNNN